MKTAWLLATCIFAMTMSAQNQPDPVDPEIKKINDEAARLTAEATKITAQNTLETAKTALANAQNPALLETARQKTLAEAAKATADLRKATADSDKAAAEAQKAALTASLPTVASKPLDGAITSDAASGYFAQVLAFDALASLADKIVDRLLESGALTANSKVYLAGAGDQLQITGQRLLIAGKLSSYNYAFAQLDEANPSKAGQPSYRAETLAALAALPALVGVAADVAAFFREDRTIAGKTVSVPANVMGQAVAGAWLRKAKRLTPPIAVEFVAPPAIVKIPDAQRAATLLGVLDGLELKYIQLTGVRESTAKQVEKDRVALDADKSALTALKTQAGAAPTPEQKASIEQATTKIAALESRIGRANDYATKLTAILASYRTFADSLLTIASGDSQSPLAKVFHNDVLSSDGQTSLFVLQVDVLTSGGEMETRKRLWGSGTVYHRAGAVCQYTLYERSGKIVASGLVAADRQSKEGAPVQSYLN